MKTVQKLAFCAAAIVGLVGCGNNEVATVTTDGSTSMEKVIGVLGESYKAETGTQVTYNPTGSSAGIKAVLEGRAQIGLSSRNLKKAEEEQGAVGTPVAYDGIALIVHPSNTVSDLTVEQVQALFTGKVTTWDGVNGAANPVVLIGREAGSGTRDGFESITKTNNQCQYRQELTSTGDVITTVSQNPNAIGYASVASLKDNVKAIKINGVEPTEANIANGSYVVQRPFLIVTKKDSLDLNAAKFVEYMTSTKVHRMIKKAGVVPASK